MLGIDAREEKNTEGSQEVRPTLNKRDPKKKPREAALETRCLEEAW